MGKVITVKGLLADPRHIELDQPVTDFSGEVEVVLRPIAKLTKQDLVALARQLQSAAPPQISDSVDLIREDRSR